MSKTWWIIGVAFAAGMAVGVTALLAVGGFRAPGDSHRHEAMSVSTVASMMIRFVNMEDFPVSVMKTLSNLL